MGEALLISLAALAGGLVAVAAREAVLAAPRSAAWLLEAIAPLARAGREGYTPSAEEQRRLALVGSGGIAAVTILLAGIGPLAAAAAAGPWCVGAMVARRRERYRRAVERAVPEVAAAIADAISGGHSVRGALVAVPGSLDGPSSAELSRVAADLEVGASTAEALAAMRARLRSERIDSLTSALLSQQVAGGDVASLMRRLAAAAADRDRVADEARAATTQARFTGLLVVALPAGAALFAELLQPGFVSRVIAEPESAAMLVAAAGLQLIGFWLIRRLGRPGE
ncbi:MAG TPA: type II secretion system F family protein [Solirubrobacterales bacterium]|nr:type II secretion system F family protein [Solirubrobacterales bacterium]